jgi:hypothetical protein
MVPRDLKSDGLGSARRKRVTSVVQLAELQMGMACFVWSALSAMTALSAVALCCPVAGD